MTSKIIIAGLIAIAFVVGSLSTATLADAKKETKAAADSFFDVFVEEIGSGPAAIHSFFDVFADIQLATGDPDFDLLTNGDPDFDLLTKMTGDPDFDLLFADKSSKITELEDRLRCLEDPDSCKTP